MKNKIKNIFAVIVLMVLPIITTFAQPSPPAPSPTNGSAPTGSNTLGCSVPVGDGVWILVAFAVVYLSYRYWQIRKASSLA
jgi:hypothetical protein